MYDEAVDKGNQGQLQMGRGAARGYKKGKTKMRRVLGFWCFSPGVGFKKIQALGPRSIILTSGTLSPLPSFEAELQVPFKTQLESPHVIKAEQVFIGVVKRGVNDIEFNFSYQNRDNQNMLDELGLTVARIAKHVPGGILIFFPSYWLLNSIYERWESSNVLSLI